MSAAFERLESCWICGGTSFQAYNREALDLSQFAAQDPELSAYTGETFVLQRCQGCGFGQPDRLPALERYFDRMYDQQWSDEWMDGEFRSTVKDYIFDTVLDELEQRIASDRRTVLDIGAHVGRFVHRALGRGWRAEGIELNPRTAAAAARNTGATIHRKNAHDLAASQERRYAAVAITDVLEHIPAPMNVLAAARGLLEPDGWIAVKVPAGPSQMLKENVRGVVRRRRAEVATNYIHVNQFSVRSLQRALESAGYVDVTMRVGAPELPPPDALRARAGNVFRMGVYRAASLLPRGVHTPLALNLQAFARRR